MDNVERISYMFSSPEIKIGGKNIMGVKIPEMSAEIWKVGELMANNIRLTRIELINTKKRVKVASRGLELLKMKRHLWNFYTHYVFPTNLYFR